MVDSLDDLLKESGAHNLGSEELSIYLDSLSLALTHLRDEFCYPTRHSIGQDQPPNDVDAKNDGEPCIYFCGNSLGLMPVELRVLLNQELDIWAGRGVLGHFDHPHKRPWKDITDTVNTSMAKLVGAKTSEVAVMGSLTSNLHTLMSTFYRPTGTRTKILFEEKAFPSDRYAFTSQARLHGLMPDEHLIPLAPRLDEYTLRTEDIIEAIEKHRDTLALVLFAGVQYYTGQFFDIPAITDKGHKVGAIVGWDLAHAVGNLPLQLHEWKVDFACWCNYKYVNAGPGAIAGIFVHSSAKYPEAYKAEETYSYHNRLAGWWGHNADTRFRMDPTFDPSPGAAGFQLSNPSVLNVVSLLASLKVFDQTSIAALRRKSILLTGYLEALLMSYSITHDEQKGSYKILSPSDTNARGAQLSVLFKPQGSGLMQHVMSYLLARGIIADEREPDVIRLSPIPMYNSFSEVRTVAKTIQAALANWHKHGGKARHESADAEKMKLTT